MKYRFGFDYDFKFSKDETVLIIGKEGETQIFERSPNADDETGWPWWPWPHGVDRVEFRGNVIAQGNIDYAFSIEGLRSIDFTGFDTSRVTSMRGLFKDYCSLESLDLSSFDTSNVTDMSEMFSFCEGIESLDLSSFDTSKVTDMSRMFYASTDFKDINLDSFDTSNVVNMSGMFAGYAGETLDLSNFDTSKVTDMSHMFWSCENLSSLDISHFDVSKVTDMKSMFSCCDKLEDLKVPFLLDDTNCDWSSDRIEKVNDNNQNGKEHVGGERLIAAFDEQRLADLNALAAEKGLVTEDEELDQFIDSVFGE